jgi:Fe-S cluster assembly protein SufD
MTTIVDFPVKPEARPYLDAFAAAANEPEWLARFRKHGISRFAEQGFPSRRSEGWRYLDLRGLQEKPRLPAAAETRLPEITRAGLWLGPIAKAIAERPDLLRRALEDEGDEAFAALNAAFFAGGFVLDIGPGATAEQPIEIVHAASSGGSIHTKTLINLAADSRATLFETYAGDGAYWRNDVVDIRLGPGAVLDRVVCVEEGAGAVHIGDVRVTLGPGAQFGAFALVLGGKTVRHELSVAMAGEGARCRIDGGFVVGGDDEANIVTTIDHRAPGGTTRELVKGVAAGRGHGAFQGTIRVREGAQQTDAQQTSRNLIIGRRAVIDTKPELEILADDVKCAHGASVGDLDEAALFYLRARGIPDDEARRLLVEGFVREAVERVADAGVRERLLERLGARLERLEGGR